MEENDEKQFKRKKPHNCQVDLKIFCVKDICCCAPAMEISALGVTRRADRFSVWGPCVKNAAVRRKMGPNAKHIQEELYLAIRRAKKQMISGKSGPAKH